MFSIKQIKKTAILLAATFIITHAAGAQFYSVPEELTVYGQQIYSGARSHFNRGSFSGYCGTYVRCQLRAMGIFDNQFDFRGNGNQWYSNFENVQKTSGGYYVYRESGSDCLKKIAENYGNDLRNIVISFPIQAGYSAAYPGAGHALVIYRLCDGIAYYSESFGFGQYREGQVLAEDVDSLVQRYSRRHGQPIGCVLLSEVDLDAVKTQQDANILLMQDVEEHLQLLSTITFSGMEIFEMSQTRVLA